MWNKVLDRLFSLWPQMLLRLHWVTGVTAEHLSVFMVTIPNQISYLSWDHTLTHTHGGTSDLILWSAKVNSAVSFQKWISLRQNLIWVARLGGEVIAKNLCLCSSSLSWKYYLCPDLLILQIHLPGKHLRSTLKTILRMNGLTPSIVIEQNGLSMGRWKAFSPQAIVSKPNNLPQPDSLWKDKWHVGILQRQFIYDDQTCSV